MTALSITERIFQAANAIGTEPLPGCGNCNQKYTRPFISICINSHNEGPRLRATVKAFRANLGDWPHEFIIIADAVTDGCADDLGDDVTVIRNGARHGCGRAKLQAIEAARGDVLLFCDAHMSVISGHIGKMATRAFTDGSIWTPVIRNIDYRKDWAPYPLNTHNQVPFADGMRPQGTQYQSKENAWCKEHHGAAIDMVGVGFCATKKTLASIGGFNAYKGVHGSQERGISLRAYMAKVPVKLDAYLVLGHEFRKGKKRPTGYQIFTTRDHALNLWHSYLVVVGEKARDTLSPILDGLAGLGKEIQKSPGVKTERARFSEFRKRTDDELLEMLGLAPKPEAPPAAPASPPAHFPVHIPYAPQDQTIGQEYNRIMRDAPTDWVLFLDHDVLLLNPHWYRVCQDIIAQQPRAGLFTCYTNNIGCKRQKDPDAPAGHDIAEHRIHARKRWDNHGATLTENKTHLIAGFFMLVNKAAWEAAGGFLETGFFGVDNDFHRRLMKSGRKVYQAEGLYCYHIRDRKQKAWIAGEKTSMDRMTKRTRAEIDNSLRPLIPVSKTALYTVLTGGYDATPPPPTVPAGWDCVLFTTDPNLKAPGWKVRTFDARGLDNVRASRIPKILPHEFLAGYDYSLYIDARIRVVGDLSRFMTRIGWPEFAATKHNPRQCIYQEAGACIRQKKDNPAAVQTQIERYRAAGMPANTGLTANGILARRHFSETARRLAVLWWDAYERAESYRDQLTLPFVLWKNGLTLTRWSATERHKFFKIGSHA